MGFAHINRVTERPTTGKTLYLVTASWRGGHDARLITLENFFLSAKDAEADMKRLSGNPRNYADWKGPFLRVFQELSA
ncbi:hypothetical protein L286_10955 [Sphingobium sp. HDIP04]|nr:hypothetical protein L286_10955 [Sphingobium sp. HDIP04]